MADPFSILGVIGVATQIIQLSVKYGSDWKSLPTDVRSFITELQALKTVLSETNTNLFCNDEFKQAFQGQRSTLLSELGPSAQMTPTQLLVSTCQRELAALLEKLKQRDVGHRFGWERFQGAFGAKALGDTVKRLQRQCQILNDMVSIDILRLHVSIQREVKELRLNQEKVRGDDSFREILGWLTPVDYAYYQRDLINRRQKGTGKWLLDSQNFQSWMKTREQTLFCPGIPGAGKTILTSIVVDELTSRFGNESDTGIAYIYCNFRRQYEQKLVDLLSSLLKQLCQKMYFMPNVVKDLYDQCKEKRTRPSLDEIIKAIQSVAVLHSKLYIIVDALDECQTSDGCRRRFMGELFNLQTKSGANVFATARFIPDIVQTFSKHPYLEIRASKNDIESYLNGQMEHVSGFEEWNEQLRDEVTQSILEAADGMFLLAQLYLNSLDDKTTPRAVRRALQHLHKHNRKSNEGQKHEILYQAYRDTMERILGQRPGFQRLAREVLSWLTCAERPLTTSELQHILAVEIGDREIGEDNFESIERMTSVCAGLVTVDEESAVIRLVHYTAQEYLESTQSMWFPEAHANITRICITYLSFTVFETGFCPTDEKFKERLLSNPFYDYAARNWGNHARSTLIDAKDHLLYEFLGNENKISACSQAMMSSAEYRVHGFSQDIPKQVTGLHLAAYFGLSLLIKELIKRGHNIEVCDTFGRSALLYATWNGHAAAVEQLLEAGADCESKDKEYSRTLLSWAAEHGNEEIIRLLLKKGANLEAKDREYGRTPLALAARRGREPVARMLLEQGAELDSKSNSGRTPLSWAARRGHKKMVRLLLDNGAELECKDSEYGRTPLAWAMRYQHTEVVALLLEYGAVHPEAMNKSDVEQERSLEGYIFDDDQGNNEKLLQAARHGQEESVILLIANGADLETKDEEFHRTPLSWAAQYGHTQVVKVLLESGADIECRDDKFDQTPLSWAARRGHESVMKLLLANNADIESRDEEYGRTPLSYAAGNGLESAMKLLIEMGADTQSKSSSGRTPLSWALQRGHTAAAQLLLENGAERPE